MSQPTAGPRSIPANTVMTLREAARRLGWKTHAVRQAKKAGLRVIRFGRQDYVLGNDVIGFFQRLAGDWR